jgi:hypothetical protein
MLVDETPPGATAEGDNADGCSVNSDVPCAAATAPRARTAAKSHPAAPLLCASVAFIVDSARPRLDISTFDIKKFDMNRIVFQLPSIPGISKKLPAAPHS